jgi:hypothetical protein
MHFLLEPYLESTHTHTHTHTHKHTHKTMQWSSVAFVTSGDNQVPAAHYERARSGLREWGTENNSINPNDALKKNHMYQDEAHSRPLI